MIRNALKSDISALYSLSQDSFDTPWSMVSFEAEFLKDHSYKYVYIKNDKIVAFLIVWTIGDEGEIVNLVVGKGWRGRGIASQLLGHIFTAHSKVKKWSLEVDAANIVAQGLYHKHGFSKTRTIYNYYGHGKDAVQMNRGQ